jgi:hypothetical protein
MKALNEEEWKAFQEKVKKIDKKQSLIYQNLIGINIFTATLTISPKKDYSEVLF